MNIKLYTPYDKQKKVHHACNDAYAKIITVCAGRQAGKSLLAMNQALYWALNKKGSLVYWVSPTAAQASKIYKELLKAVGNSDLIKSNKGGTGDTEIIFKNDSIIKFRSAAQEDSLRGESVRYMIIDEAAFIKEEVWHEILMPMLNVKGKKCLIVSTPKGKNWFHTSYLRGVARKDKHKSYKFTSADNPHCNLDIIAMAKESMPDVLFNQEYMAQFVDSAAVFDNIEELATMINNPVARPGESYYIGIDIGMKNDYTVVTVLNKKREMVYYDRFTNVTSPVLKERLIGTFDIFRPKKIFLELNNQGGPIYDDLKVIHKVKNIVGFNTTGKSKPEIINALIASFSKKDIKVVNDDIIKSELEAFTMSFSSTGSTKFSAPSGFHDDIVMSLAIANECLNKNIYSGKISFH